MTILLVVGTALVTALAVALTVAALAGRYLARNAQRYPTVLDTPRYPCYRCGEVVAETEYMGLRYCLMCRIVVIRAYPMVAHDPPYGFPGAPGYLDWPERALGKKEVELGEE